MTTTPSKVGTESDGVASEVLSFTAADGWELQGDLIRGNDPQLAILLSAGTGFPRQYYRHVGTYLASKGAIVLTFDYRGIGGSGSGDLRGSAIDYPDWGRLDMPAALDALAASAPGLPLTHIGHSIGGSFVGLMHNHGRIERQALVAAGSGYWKHHHLRRIPLEMYFWWLLGPVSLARSGYIDNIGGWRGAALPPKLFKTWRRWSHNPKFYGNDLVSSANPHYFADVVTPTLSWRFSDDPIATETAVNVILDHYSRIDRNMILRTPAQMNVRRIGHEGAFRPGRESLWDEWWEWLADGNTPSNP